MSTIKRRVLLAAVMPITVAGVIGVVPLVLGVVELRAALLLALGAFAGSVLTTLAAPRS